MYPQVRGEPGRLPLPVADQRHRAHQQRRPAAVRRDQREQLDRLAQAHVVGQDAAQAEPAEEGQPGKPSFLVGPQLAGEARGSGHRPQPPVHLAGQQVTQPAVGVHADQRDVLVRTAQADGQRVGRRHRPGRGTLEELQRGLDVRVVQLHPLPAQPDQRDLEPGQLRQFLRVKRLVADGHVVAEVHQVTQAELRPGDRGSGRALRAGGQLQAEPRLAHPVRQQHAEPGAGKQRPGLLEEPERARRIQLHQGRGRLAQRVLELAEQPHARAQPGQQLLHRVAPEPGSLPGPHVRGGDHEAGVIGGLQRELDPPRVGFRRGRLGEPEAGPHRAGRDPRPVQPGVELRGQFPGRCLVLRRHHLEAGIGRGQGDHEPFGHRKASRSPASPGGQERRGQAGPRRGVGEGFQGAGQQPPRRLTVERPARRRHRRRQVTPALRVGAAEHRTPPGRVAIALGRQDRQHPAAGGQVGGEASHRGQVGQRTARDGHGVIQAVQAAEQGQRGGGVEGDGGHPPPGQRGPAAGSARGRTAGPRTAARTVKPRTVKPRLAPDRPR